MVAGSVAGESLVRERQSLHALRDDKRLREAGAGCNGAHRIPNPAGRQHSPKAGPQGSQHTPLDRPFPASSLSSGTHPKLAPRTSMRPIRGTHPKPAPRTSMRPIRGTHPKPAPRTSMRPIRGTHPKPAPRTSMRPIRGTHPKPAPRTSMRPIRGSIGSLASIVPSGVSLSATSRASISARERRRRGGMMFKREVSEL